MIFGVELLPFHLVYLIAIALFFYGYSKKSILITNLSAIALVLIGLYGMVQPGFPTVTGSTETTYTNGTVITTKTITNVTDFAIDTVAIITCLIGAISLILVNFELWKEQKYPH